MPFAEDLFVEPDWLEGRLDDPAVVVFDASYFPAGVERDPEREFAERRVPGARRLDIRALSDPTSPYPNMLPRRSDLAAFLRTNGVGAETVVVVYDSLGLYGAARALWMLRAFGVDSSYVLVGGLPRWMADGRPTECGPLRSDGAADHHVTSVALCDPRGVARREEVAQSLSTPDGQAVDARGVRDPHGYPTVTVPGFTRAPYDLFVQGGQLEPPRRIRQIAGDVGLRLDAPIIVTCGTGVAAAVVWLALRSIDAPVRLYDGGFAEWLGSDTAAS